MGMTDEMFWHSTPAQFTLRVEAYKRHNRADAMYFRETFALLYNINRSEKAEVLEGKDILMLHGEKPPRKERREKSLMDDPVALADYMARLKSMNDNEVEEAAFFGLPPHDYVRRRSYNQITTEMVAYFLRKKYFEENPDAAPDSFVLRRIAEPQPLDPNAAPFPLDSLVMLKAKIEAELNPGAEPIPVPVTPVEEANAAPVLVAESEPETRAETNSFVPPGLTGEPIPIQPSQWD